MDITQPLNVYMRLGDDQPEQLVGTIPVPATLTLADETGDNGERQMVVTTRNVGPHLAAFLRTVADEVERAAANL